MYTYEECGKCRREMRAFKKNELRKRRKELTLLIITMAILFGYLIWQVNRNFEEEVVTVYKPIFTEVSASPYQMDRVEEIIVVQSNDSLYEYNPLALPASSTGEFKTYMDYRKITNTSSRQWSLQQLAETNEEGFRVFNGRYLVAVGSYYATEVGKELRITLEDGTVFYAMVGDLKQDVHTDENNQYVPLNGNIIEFIVDVDKLDPITKKLGNVSNSGLEGKIAMIEEVMNFEQKVNSN